MKIIYQANDGTIFDDEYSCIQHEFICSISTISLPVMRDKDNYDIDYSYLDLISDDLFNSVCLIEIETQEQIDLMNKVSNFSGFYDDINSIGTWIYSDALSKFVKIK
jgi:hypothetical protein